MPAPLIRRPFLRAALLVLALSAMTATAAEAPHISNARTMETAGMVDLRMRVPDISQDIRYAGRDNFIGAPVDGYEAPACWLRHEAATALARVEMALRRENRRLHLFDCYRPVRAVAHFMRWLDEADDPRTRAVYYPTLEKSLLRGTYIAPQSGHSRGATVDLTLLACDADDAACAPLDMGTPFDFFGSRAHTDSDEVDAAQRANRHALRAAMAAEGFVNLPEEWWHFRLQPEPTPGIYYDVPVTSAGLPAPSARDRARVDPAIRR